AAAGDDQHWTTNMRRPASGGILLRARPPGARTGGGGWGGADRLDQPRCRASFDELDEHDTAAIRLYFLVADDTLDRIIAALDQHVRLQATNQLDRGLLVEADHRVDRFDS